MTCTKSSRISVNGIVNQCVQLAQHSCHQQPQQKTRTSLPVSTYTCTANQMYTCHLSTYAAAS